MTTAFDSLTKALERCFEKPLAKLPGPLRERVKSSFFPFHWDGLSADQRLNVATHWDWRNDPATEEERESIFAMSCKRLRITEDIQKLESMRIETPRERESQQRQLEDLRGQLKTVEDQFKNTTTAHSRGNKAVPSHEIVAHFRVKEPTKNEAWWNARMRDAKRYKLVECRASPGRARRPSFWYPDRVAAWLVGRGDMESSKVVATLHQHFPDYADNAHLI